MPLPWQRARDSRVAAPLELATAVEASDSSEESEESRHVPAASDSRSGESATPLTRVLEYMAVGM